MAVSKTQIGSLSLSNIGNSRLINDIDTDETTEAKALREFYDHARKETLVAIRWGFAKRYVEPGLVSNNPTPHHAYAYRYPVKGLFVRRIINPCQAVDTPDTKIPYEIAGDDNGMLILTNKSQAMIEYTYDEENPARFPVEFDTAFSYNLSHKIIPRIGGGDPFKLKNEMWQMFIFWLKKAAATSVNQQFAGQPISSFERARL